MELLKLLSANEVVAQIISFLVLFFLLRALAWSKLLKLLDDRKAKIASEFKAIEDTKAGLIHIKADYDDRIRRIEEVQKAKIEEGILEGKRIAQEIKDDASHNSQKMIAEAKEEIRGELSKARESLKEEIIDITLDVAKKVIGERLTEGQDRKLVEDFIKDMDKA